MALKYIKKHGGFVIYLQQEGRGIGLANKVAAYSLQDHGLDTVDANLHLGFPDDAREYSVVPSILKDMQIPSIALMTNNPRKTNMLCDLGVVIEKTLPMVVPHTNQYNHKYMETKVSRMDHRNMGELIQNSSEFSSVSPLTTLPGNIAERLAVANGMMAPRRKIGLRGGESSLSTGSDSNTTSMIDDVVAMPANAVQVSLELLNNEEKEHAELDDDQVGIEARDDGYCLGKQSVTDAIAAVKRGEMIVVVDDLDRENEGDFIMAADKCTDLDMAQIVRYSSGVVCIGMEADRMAALKLPAMVTNNEDPKGTAFSVTVDATKEHGITTGISAGDRATTIRMLANPNTVATDFHRPGHIFPLRACSGGVLERNGHTEAAVDFAKLAGLNPAGVLCEIVSEDNPTEMMRLPEIKRFCKQHQYILTSIADLAQYRREMEQL
jgi:3,4-dihydroxy 2-butanone 4-phosphate synthase / GTP cyclohydrolase II